MIANDSLGWGGGVIVWPSILKNMIVIYLEYNNLEDKCVRRDFKVFCLNNKDGFYFISHRSSPLMLVLFNISSKQGIMKMVAEKSYLLVQDVKE